MFIPPNPVSKIFLEVDRAFDCTIPDRPAPVCCSGEVVSGKIKRPLDNSLTSSELSGN